ncbi:serine/threonine protein kinase [Arenibacterium sp. LLYu02]|uniref:serine/threonine protein kinase n=1 Tax=Arenibacterium sp. LLYu02 TaxID=3404132 RepID=UPI003B217BA6
MLHQSLSVAPLLSDPLAADLPVSDLPEVCDQDELPCGARLLQGQYQIEQALIAGGFGITYLARDSLDRRVVVKECFPGEICERVAGQVRPRGPAQLRTYKAVLRSFLREAHLLARSQHPNIVPVHQVFRENGTAYIAMDFIDGLDLLTLRETAPARITPQMIDSCLRQSLAALDFLHGQGILHRDISPDNLIWTSADRLMLIDFGAACPILPDDARSADEPMAVKDGYSPHELYDRSNAARAASDLYALAATLVFLRRGEPPVTGPERLSAVTHGAADPMEALLAEAVTESPLWHTVARALSILPKDRFATAQDWLAALPQESAPVAAPRPRLEAPAGAPTDLQPQLLSRIASLVAETNGNLTAGLPKVLQPEPVIDPEAEARNKPKPVDLFGQPISDLQAWLSEQDSAPRRDLRKPAPRAAVPADQARSTPQTEAAPARGLLSLNRFFGKRTASPSGSAS